LPRSNPMPERRKGTQGSKRPANTVAGKNGRPVRQSRDRFRLTALEQQIVGLYAGNISDVAKALGKTRQNVWTIVQRPIVAEALTKKQQVAIVEAGKILGQEIAKNDVLARLFEMAKVHHRETKHSLDGQIRACEVLAKIQKWLTDNPT